MPIADDQLALAAADGHHAVYGEDAGLKGAFYGRAVNDARRAVFYWPCFHGGKRRAIQRAAEGIDYAANHAIAHANISHSACAACDCARRNKRVRIEERCTNGVHGKVEHKPINIMIKLQNFPIAAAGKAMDGNYVILGALHNAVTVNGRLEFVFPNLFVKERAQCRAFHVAADAHASSCSSGSGAGRGAFIASIRYALTPASCVLPLTS